MLRQALSLPYRIDSRYHSGMPPLSRRAFSALSLTAAVPVQARAPTDRLASILARGEVRIGVWLGAAPWGFLRDRGDMDGSEVELARRIAADLGVRAILLPVTFNERIPAVVRGDVDLLCATLSILPDRMRRIAFAHAHGRFDVAMGVREDNPVRRPGDLAGRAVIALEQGAARQSVEERFLGQARIMPVPDYAAALTAFAAHPEAILAVPDFTLRRMILDHPELRIEARGVLGRTAYAIAIQQGQPDLLRFINTSVFLMDQDGTLAEIHQRHARAPRPRQARL